MAPQVTPTDPEPPANPMQSGQADARGRVVVSGRGRAFVRLSGLCGPGAGWCVAAEDLPLGPAADPQCRPVP